MTDTELIKDKIDVVDLINEYVQLKPAGVNHKGLCPFHHEKSPSFMVNRERQRWHCFGCSKDGDIFTFIQEIEGMDFVEALTFLANRAGVTLTKQIQEQSGGQKQRIKDVVAEAARFFHKFLLQLPAAEPARAYLARRGVTEQTIESWQIGYISDQWDLLTKYLLKKGYAVDDLVAAGLTIKRDGADARTQRGYYDRFRGRVMFPICDVHGTVVGFTGRVLVETEHSGGKYVNTPQTMLYDKSRVVFGLHKAKQAIRTNAMIVMVEGQMDVIASHQTGMEYVVATSGTAMTEHQVQLLKRYANTIAIAFDADAAGQAAAKRGIDIARAEGMNIKVIRIPDGAGKDPDECIKKDPKVWFDAVRDAVDIMEWYLLRAFTGKRITDPKDKQTIVNEVLPEIVRIPYATERDHWLRELSLRLGVDTAVLREDMERIKKQGGQQSAVSSQSASPQHAGERTEDTSTRLESLIEGLFTVVFRFPKLSPERWLERLHPALSTSRYAPLYEVVKSQYTTERAIHPIALVDITSSLSHLPSVDVLLMKGEHEFGDFTERDAEQELRQLEEQIHSEWTRQERKRIQHEIEQAEKSGDTEKIQGLLEKFHHIT